MKPTVANPICIGSGLIALDVIYSDNDRKPRFLAGGSCANVLTILSYLGWRSFPLARLGSDPEGSRIIEDMQEWGVKTRFVNRDPGIHSPRIIEKIFSGRRPRHRFYLKCAHRKWLPARSTYLLKSLESIQNKLPQSGVFYFDRASPSALKVASMLRDRGAIIVFEPPKFQSTDNFIKCLQVAHIVKHCYDQSEETERSGVNIPLEIQTMGENGLRYRARVLKQKRWKHIDAFPVNNLVDAAGSGDWLTAGLLYTLFRQRSWNRMTTQKLEKALKFGSALASLNCNFAGARGIMYSVKKPRLFRLAEKLVHEQAVTEISDTQDRKIPSKFASKCRVCLCGNRV